MYSNNLAQQWLTTADAARALRVTAEGVRWLVQQGRLACERTRSGQYLFRAYDVAQLAHDRARAVLATVRPQMLKARSGPRQQALFGAQVRFAPWLALGDRQAKGRAIVRKRAG